MRPAGNTKPQQGGNKPAWQGGKSQKDFGAKPGVQTAPNLNTVKPLVGLDFRGTLHAASQLVNTQSLMDRVKERKVKQMKMPMSMLKGIREKKIKMYKEQLERNKREGVTFSTSDKKIDVDFYLEKKRKENFKNLLGEEKSYKFRGMNDDQKDRQRFLKQSSGPGKKTFGVNKNKGLKFHEGVMRFKKSEVPNRGLSTGKGGPGGKKKRFKSSKP